MNISSKGKAVLLYLDGKTSWFQWVWLGTFLCMSLYAFWQGIFNGGIFCAVFAFSSFLFRSGTQADERNKRIRHYMWFAGISWGKWYPLENYKYIVVSHLHRRSRKTGEETSSYKIFLASVNIYKYQSIMLETLYDWETAVNRGNHLGKLLKMEVKLKPTVGTDV